MLSRFANFISRGLVRFIPPEYVDADYETSERAFVLVHSSVTGALGLLGTAQMWSRYGGFAHIHVVLTFVQSLVALLIPVFFRLSGSLRISSAISPLTSLISLPVSAIYTGGVGSPSLLYMLISVLYGSYFLGARFGGLVLFLSSVEVITLDQLMTAGYLRTSPPSHQDQVSSFISVGGLLLLFAWINERGSKHTQSIIARKEAALREALVGAEAATRSKSSFLATMSHEIRTPLNGVLGTTNLLLDTELTGIQKDLADTLHQSGNALLAVLNDILDFSKIEAGQMALEQHAFGLTSCVESSIELFGAQAAEQGIELYADLDRQLPERLVGDPTRLRQVLVNLLGNAVKFTRKGEVCLRIRALPNEDQKRVSLSFEIEDTGVGIPKDRRGNLFQPFMQAESSTTRRFGGTGLGLVITKRLVDLMGGSISVKSEEGQGTCFRVELTLPKAPENVKGTGAYNLPNLLGKAALVVGKHEKIRGITARLLRGWGLKITEVANGAEAHAELAKHKFDVAIIERHHNDEDGLDVGHDNALSGLPIVLLTPRPQDALEMPRGIQVLVKPVRQSRIAEALATAFGGLKVLPRPALFASATGETNPLHILVAEDNPVNQKIILMMLTRLGYRADLAGNGAEAIEAVRRKHYDLVFMDVQMPDVDGITAARRIRDELGDTKRPAIVAMTANVSIDDRKACAEAGMKAFIAKPIVPEELASVLRETRSKPIVPDAVVAVERENILDMEKLDALRALTADMPGAFAELVGEHIEFAERTIQEIDAALRRDDMDAAGRLAHSLRGNSGQFGAYQVAAAAAEIEKMSSMGAKAEATKQLATLEQAFSMARSCFKEEIRRQVS